MANGFDPYHKWLGIAADEQPANHYRLLGIRAFESDPDVIAGAADQRMVHVRSFQSGRYSEMSQRVLNELAAARVCLLNPKRKAGYDERLRAEHRGHPAGAPPLPVPGPVQPGRELPGLPVAVTPVPPATRRRRPDWQVPVAVAAATVALAVGLVGIFAVRSHPRQEVPKLPDRGAAIGETADRNREVVRERRRSRVDDAHDGAATRAAATDGPEPREPLDPEPARLPPPRAVAPFNAAQAANHQRAWSEYLGVPVEKRNSVGMKFVLIPPGEFMMGSSDMDPCARDDEKPERRVRITRPFYLSKHPVTQHQWQAVMGTNPSRFKGPQNPVENVSWNDCQEFLQRLNEKAGDGRREFRLPTEAEWEYACRAGTTTRYSFGDDARRLGDYAWYGDNSGGRPHPVGRKPPNAWGLYDTHGNVLEWCSDWYDGSYYDGQSPVDDPPGPTSGSCRVLRGGCWGSGPRCCRSAGRYWSSPAIRSSYLGFRLVMVPAPARSRTATRRTTSRWGLTKPFS